MMLKKLLQNESKNDSAFKHVKFEKLENGTFRIGDKESFVTRFFKLSESGKEEENDKEKSNS